MKKWKILIFFTLIFFSSCKSKEEKMLDYMKNRYGEEFVLGFAGGRGDTLIVNTMPKRYLGTPKERDKYYHGQIFFERNDIGDNYGAVVINEGANEYVRPKLEELFGKNILIALNLEGEYKYPNFQKELNRRKENRKDYMFSCEAPLSGGIYIFGRAENEKDREKYRKGIYEFIQYLKQEGMFEYCNIWITVVDERFLSKNFNTEEFIEKYNADATKTKENYRKERRRLIKKYDDDFKNTSEKEKRDKIGSLIKSDLYGTNAIGMDEVSGENELLVVGIFSPKFLNRYSDSKQYWINEGGITEDYNGYNSINEVKFYEEKY